jgi:RimJ/RimL family protein N-acetyltransferase
VAKKKKNQSKNRKASKRRRKHYRHENVATEPTTPVLFPELDGERRSEILERLDELIGDFFSYTEYLPSDEDRDEILKQLCDDVSDIVNYGEPEPFDVVAHYSDPRFDFDPALSFDEKIALFQEVLEKEAEEYDPYAEPEEPESEPRKELVVDSVLHDEYDKIVASCIAGLKVDGFELPTYLESLTVAETKRLVIRRFYSKDMDALWKIMLKPEVMYSWGNGFHKREVKKWLNQQYTRYQKDGYGYFAVTLKNQIPNPTKEVRPENVTAKNKPGKLIGQAGLMKSDINGESVVEIGCIFSNAVWGQGYATEAAAKLCDIVFGETFSDCWLEEPLEKLHATMRPDNESAIKLAEKLGMRKIGKCVKIHKEAEIPHDVYIIDVNTWKEKRLQYQQK